MKLFKQYVEFVLMSKTLKWIYDNVSHLIYMNNMKTSKFPSFHVNNLKHK